MRARSPGWPVSTRFPFDAQVAAERIEVPALVMPSENALSPDLAHRFFTMFKTPKSELWLSSQGQIDFYDDPDLIAPAADAIARFFAEALELSANAAG